MKSRQFERWAPVVLAIALVLLWQVGVTTFEVPEFIFPSPWQIALQFAEYKGPLMAAAWSTFWVTMVGFGLAIVVGVLLGFLIGSSRVAYAALYPLMVGFNAVPKAAIVPILVVWFGIGIGPGITTAVNDEGLWVGIDRIGTGLRASTTRRFGVYRVTAGVDLQSSRDDRVNRLALILVPPAEAPVATADGQHHSRAVPRPLGHPRHPMSPADLEAKFQTCVEPKLGAAAAAIHAIPPESRRA